MFHLRTAALAALAVVLTPAFASAAWQTTSSGGSGIATASALTAPSGGAALAAGTTSMTISWTAPTAGTPQAASTYYATGGGTCNAPATSGNCTVTGLAAGTSYNFQLAAKLGTNWTSASSSTFGGTTTTSTLVLTKVLAVSSQNNNKVKFTGTGGSGATVVTVTICASNRFPCASPAGTASAGSATSPWTTGQSGPGNLTDNQTYYAQATQGALTSSVLTFTNASLPTS